eukprot:COSAG01_NODE_5986_length_3918_cov_3.255564_5_plen_124_part_00
MGARWCRPPKKTLGQKALGEKAVGLTGGAGRFGMARAHAEEALDAEHVRELQLRTRIAMRGGGAGGAAAASSGVGAVVVEPPVTPVGGPDGCGGRGGECFPRVGWVAVPEALRARRVSRRRRR